LNHGDVVATVADAAYAFLGEFANQAGNVCLLRWRAAAGYDSGQLDGYGDEFLAEVLEEQRERLSINEEACV
jgi:hypothetical protein